MGYSGKCSQPEASQATTEGITLHAHFLWLPYDYNSMTTYSLVCGYIGDEQIHRVAVRWQDGTVSRAVLQNQRFLVTIPNRHAACQLQLFDQVGTLLRTIRLQDQDFVSSDATTPLPHCRDSAST